MKSKHTLSLFLISLVTAPAMTQVPSALDYSVRAGDGLMAVDDEGFLYIVTDQTLPVVNPPEDTTSTGSWLAKIDPSNDRIEWTTQFGGAIVFGLSWGRDSGGDPHVYVCGWTLAPDFGEASFDMTRGNGRDGYVLMFDTASGEKQAGLYTSKTDADIGVYRSVNTMTVHDGSLYVVGNGDPTDLWYEDAIDSQGPGPFVMKIAGDLTSLDWSTLLPSDGSPEIVYDVAVDADDHVYVAGYTESANPVDLGVYDHELVFDGQHNGRRDGFVAKLEQRPDGAGGTEPVAKFYTYLGGGDDDAIHDLFLADGAVYLAGFTRSNDFPATDGSQMNGRSDAFFARLDADLGSLEFASYFGGSREEGTGVNANDQYNRTIGIAVMNDHLHLTGTTKSGDLPTTPGAVDATHDSAPSRNDVFVARFDITAAAPSLTELSYLGGGDADNTRTPPVVDTSGRIHVAFFSGAADPDETLSQLPIDHTAFVGRLRYGDPQLQPGFTIVPTSGLVTTEAGGTDSFTVVLNTQPSLPVDLGIASTVPGEAWVSSGIQGPGPSILIGFDSTNWDQPQTVDAIGLDDGVSDGDVAYTLVTTVLTSDPVYASLDAPDVTGTNLDDEPPPPGVEFFATGQDTVEGTVSGSFTATQAEGGPEQSIAETESNGKPSKRRSSLEHRWSFSDVQGGNLEVRVLARMTDADGDGDDGFQFEYLGSGGAWIPIGGPISGSTTEERIAPLSTTGGTVWVRVVDTDNGQGNRDLDTVHVDFLVIRSL